MNKWLTIFAASILALGFAVGGFNAAWSKGMKGTAAEFRASKIMGMEVKDLKGQKLGKIEDLLMDPQESWRVSFAVLDPARSLEFGHGRLIAIPFTALSRSDTERIYILSVTRAKLTKAPSFDEDHWPNVADRSWSAEVYRYYGQAPYWAEGQ